MPHLSQDSELFGCATSVPIWDFFLIFDFSCVSRDCRSLHILIWRCVFQVSSRYFYYRVHHLVWTWYDRHSGPPKNIRNALSFYPAGAYFERSTHFLVHSQSSFSRKSHFTNLWYFLVCRFLSCNILGNLLSHLYSFSQTTWLFSKHFLPCFWIHRWFPVFISLEITFDREHRNSSAPEGPSAMCFAKLPKRPDFPDNQRRLQRPWAGSPYWQSSTYMQTFLAKYHAKSSRYCAHD